MTQEQLAARLMAGLNGPVSRIAANRLMVVHRNHSFVVDIAQAEHQLFLVAYYTEWREEGHSAFTTVVALSEVIDRIKAVTHILTRQTMRRTQP